MNDWTKEPADKVKKQQDQKVANDAKFLEIQRLKKEFGPTLWKGLVAEVKNSCNVMNQQIGNIAAAVTAPTPDNELKVRNENTPARQLSAHFDVDKAQIAWEVSPLQGGNGRRALRGRD